MGTNSEAIISEYLYHCTGTGHSMFQVAQSLSVVEPLAVPQGTDMGMQ